MRRCDPLAGSVKLVSLSLYRLCVLDQFVQKHSGFHLLPGPFTRFLAHHQARSLPSSFLPLFRILPFCDSHSSAGPSRLSFFFFHYLPIPPPAWVPFAQETSLFPFKSAVPSVVQLEPNSNIFNMAGQGAGPSRRSHTKSRTGCKTCKRRHIRCDETFPQW